VLNFRIRHCGAANIFLAMPPECSHEAFHAFRQLKTTPKPSACAGSAEKTVDRAPRGTCPATADAGLGLKLSKHPRSVHVAGGRGTIGSRSPDQRARRRVLDFALLSTRSVPGCALGRSDRNLFRSSHMEIPCSRVKKSRVWPVAGRPQRRLLGKLRAFDKALNPTKTAAAATAAEPRRCITARV
jgi:hypothetical protein